MERNNKQIDKIFAAPSHELLIATNPDKTRPLAVIYTERDNRTPSMKAHEFALIMSILLQNEETLSSLIISGLDLIQIYQQQRENIDLFWDTVVATLFNDEKVNLAL